MFFWLSLIIVLAALGTIGVVLWRRWKEIRLLDPETIRSEQERNVRDRILRERFDRSLKRWFAPMRRSMKRFAGRVSSSVQHLEDRLKCVSGMEHDGTRGGEKSFVSKRVRRMLREAAELEREGKTSKAEQVYLEVLKLDVRNFQAYRGLGALYFHARQYKQAKETFEFLVKIQGADDSVFAGLGKIAEMNGDAQEAERMYMRALSMNVKLPERHAEIAAFYLRRGSPEDAWRHTKSACELEPNSPSYLELSVESAILLRDRKEAEARYERLRLMQYDRQKLRRLKERLDTME